MMVLKPNERRILEFIIAYHKKKGWPPNNMDIQKAIPQNYGRIGATLQRLHFKGYIVYEGSGKIMILWKP